MPPVEKVYNQEIINKIRQENKERLEGDKK